MENGRQADHQKVEPAEDLRLLTVPELVPDGEGVERVLVPHVHVRVYEHRGPEAQPPVEAVGKDDGHAVLLQAVRRRIEKAQQQAEQDFSSRQETLLSPVMKKAQDAIDKVAKAQGLAYVFDLATGAIIYIDEANTVNLLPLVKAELGIPASKTQPTQFQ